MHTFSITIRPGFHPFSIVSYRMGFFIAFLSALSATAKDVVSKSLASKVHSDTSTLASFLFALPYYLVLIMVAQVCGMNPLEYSGSFIALVLARSATDVFAEGFKMRAFAHGDISLVSSFLSLSPLVLALLSPYITGDRVTTHDYVAIGCIVLGSLLLIRRDVHTGKVLQLKAMGYALLASIAFALNSCFDRLAVVQSGALISGFSMTAVAALFCLPVAFRHSAVSSELKLHAGNFLVRGAFETAFMVFKLFAMRFLEAHVVLGILRTSLLLSVLAGKVVFSERDIGRRLLASACMYVGLLILFWGHVYR